MAPEEYSDESSERTRTGVGVAVLAVLGLKRSWGVSDGYSGGCGVIAVRRPAIRGDGVAVYAIHVASNAWTVSRCNVPSTSARRDAAPRASTAAIINAADE
jgi:hypothetical protein